MDSTEYQPGTVAVATVRGVEDVRVMRCGKNGCGDFWWSPEYVIEWRQHEDRDVTDVRPLVVLDLSPHPENVTRLLAQALHQIEAQTKPPRIPEPGLWGVVEASCVHEVPRGPWINDGRGWARIGRQKIATENHDDWDSLIDPTLIREGVES